MRFIESHIETEIAGRIISGSVSTKEKYIVDVDDKNNVIVKKS